MKYDDTDKLYMQIGGGRLLDIEVYNGMVEDAPEEVKKLYYSKVIMNGKQHEYYTYSKFNT